MSADETMPEVEDTREADFVTLLAEVATRYGVTVIATRREKVGGVQIESEYWVEPFEGEVVDDDEEDEEID